MRWQKSGHFAASPGLMRRIASADLPMSRDSSSVPPAGSGAVIQGSGVSIRSPAPLRPRSRMTASGTQPMSAEGSAV